MFDFDTSYWYKLAPTGSVPAARKGHSACLILGSMLAVFGGYNQAIGANCSALLYERSSYPTPQGID